MVATGPIHLTPQVYVDLSPIDGKKYQTTRGSDAPLWQALCKCRFLPLVSRLCGRSVTLKIDSSVVRSCTLWTLDNYLVPFGHSNIIGTTFSFLSSTFNCNLQPAFHISMAGTPPTVLTWVDNFALRLSALYSQ